MRNEEEVAEARAAHVDHHSSTSSVPAPATVDAEATEGTTHAEGGAECENGHNGEDADGKNCVLEQTGKSIVDTVGAAEHCEVGAWLFEVDTSLSQYAVTFAEDGFDSMAAVSTMTDSDLKNLGVKTGHRRVILAAIEEERPQ